MLGARGVDRDRRLCAFGGGSLDWKRAAKLLAVCAPVAVLAAGCGTAASPSNASSGVVIQASARTIDTNSVSTLSARTPSGGAAAVEWLIAGGQNDASIGQGSIDSKGVYTPPPLISQDAVGVTVRAVLKGEPAIGASYSITVTPGFVQALSPENASLAPGGVLRVSGEISEVNSGAMRWFVASSPDGADAGAAYGTVGVLPCRHSPQAYTQCSATYTAPAIPPAGSVFLVATPANSPRSRASVHILLNSGGFNSSPLPNRAPQTGVVEMGGSGGNANDFDSSMDAQGDQYVKDCCGGTLGALVEDQNSNLYILSNNHVLAESDEGRTGDSIVQPALIDQNCNPQAGRTVGALRYAVPISDSESNADAALALATPAVDPFGNILQLGPPANGSLTAASPAGGVGENVSPGEVGQMRVVKSGRTTGLTCSTVDTIDLSVEVDYYYDCAETKPYYTKTFTNQIGIPGAGFADSGDSGALVLDAANAQPVGLFFAGGSGEGGSGLSVANPIQDVLAELGRDSHAPGMQFKIVGGPPHSVSCSDYDRDAPPAGLMHTLNEAQSSAARSAADYAAATLIRPDNGVLGVLPGKSLDNPGEGAVIVYVERNRPVAAIPKSIAGARTVVIPTDAASVDAGTAPLAPPRNGGIHPSNEAWRAAAAAQQKFAPQWMSDPAIFGVGVTQSLDNPADAALLVLVDMKKNPEATPDFAGGLRVRYLRLNRLHVTRSKGAGAPRPTSCELRAARRTSAPSAAGVADAVTTPALQAPDF